MIETSYFKYDSTGIGEGVTVRTIYRDPGDGLGDFLAALLAYEPAAIVIAARFNGKVDFFCRTVFTAAAVVAFVSKCMQAGPGQLIHWFYNVIHKGLVRPIRIQSSRWGAS